ncbi:MAG: helix-turn-helix domain-containing protein [Bacteroidota bacterium]
MYKSIILVGLVQGIVLCFSLTIKTFGYKNKNLYFISLIGIITLLLLAKYLYTADSYRAFPHIWYVFDTAAYLIGPLWYLTLLKSTRSKLAFGFKKWVYLLPILVHIVFLVRISLLSAEELLSVANARWFLFSFYAFSLSVIIVNLAYFIKASRIIRYHQDIRFPELLRKGHAVFSLILMLWLVVFCISFALDSTAPIKETAYNVSFISFAFLTFGLAVLAIIKPASFYFLTQVYDSSETFLLKEIADKILNHLTSNEPFLDSHYSLSKLAEEIDANPTLTSKAINRIIKKSFSDLINQFRVAYFLKSTRTNQWPHLTHPGIAEKSGFGNKVSFYKAFKRETGMTPKTYLAQHG